jgi:hypothetical protein
MHHSKLVYIACSPYLNSGVKLIRKQLHLVHSASLDQIPSTVSKVKHVKM